MSGLILELEEAFKGTLNIYGFHIAYHSRTRFAMTSNCVEALAPLSDTAISKINLSSSLGKNGPREIVMDIERSKFEIQKEVYSPRRGWRFMRIQR